MSLPRARALWPLQAALVFGLGTAAILSAAGFSNTAAWRGRERLMADHNLKAKLFFCKANPELIIAAVARERPRLESIP